MSYPTIALELGIADLGDEANHVVHRAMSAIRTRGFTGIDSRTMTIETVHNVGYVRLR